MYAAIQGIFISGLKKCSNIRAVIKRAAPAVIVTISFFKEFSP